MGRPAANKDKDQTKPAKQSAFASESENENPAPVNAAPVDESAEAPEQEPPAEPAPELAPVKTEPAQAPKPVNAVNPDPVILPVENGGLKELTLTFRAVVDDEAYKPITLEITETRIRKTGQTEDDLYQETLVSVANRFPRIAKYEKDLVSAIRKGATAKN